MLREEGRSWQLAVGSWHVKKERAEGGGRMKTWGGRG